MKKICLIPGSYSNIDFNAFKYFILSLNSKQKLFEFSFPDLDDLLYKNPKTVVNQDNSTMDFKHFIVKNELHDKYDCWFAIIPNQLSKKYFFVYEENVAVITTDIWEKSFAPPSVFEYLLHSIISCLLYFDSCKNKKSHMDTRGCILDFTRTKHDD